MIERQVLQFTADKYGENQWAVKKPGARCRVSGTMGEEKPLSV
jgi:hypothetical protein